MAATIAIVNQKGGVGKTATAVNLGAGLALAGHATLLVDLDAQSGTTVSLGAEMTPSSIAGCLFDELGGREAICPTRTAGLDLLSSSDELSHADLILSNMPGRETRLTEVLAPVAAHYHTILIDCPPSLGLLLVNALVAADYFLVPVVPHFLSLKGVEQLLQTVEQVRHGIGHSAQLLGLVLTQVDLRLRVARELSEILRENFGEQVFQTVIPTNVALAEAPAFGQSIFEYAPGSSGAKAYQRLMREVLRRMS